MSAKQELLDLISRKSLEDLIRILKLTCLDCKNVYYIGVNSKCACKKGYINERSNTRACVYIDLSKKFKEEF